jgi:ATP-dependent Lon protease
MVVFPYQVVPLLVGRSLSVNAVRAAMEGGRLVLAAAQRKPEVAEPSAKDLHDVGTVVRILQVLRLPDDTLKVLVEGLGRARVGEVRSKSGHHVARVVPFGSGPVAETTETVALMRRVLAQFEEYVRLNRKLPDEILITAGSITNAERFTDTVAAHLLVGVEPRQRILEADTLVGRLDLLNRVLSAEVEILRLEKKIEGQVRTQVQKNQKEFYLNEQLKAIKKELGFDGDGGSEGEEMEKAVREARMPKEVQAKALAEVEKLRKMAPMSPEATVVRNYVQYLAAMPWRKTTRDRFDIREVERVLDEDHYGLHKVKERIVEYVAVMRLSGKLKGPILCFVGPPGVGKTSLGKSIARALGRKFVRVSLGGIRDEAEIRGHRRTYIGSMPGRIVQGIRKAGVKNPVFLLDEVDKMTVDFHGDPASALLEVLDPEQNSTFNDHYLDVDFDLSQVLFITTANVLHGIPPALQDRMEIIRLPGYLLPEKLKIAKGFLVPHQAEAHGLPRDGVRFADAALRKIVLEYTREAGVRNLEREIAAVLRKVARDIARRGGSRRTAKAAPRVQITSRHIARHLGVPRFTLRRLERKNGVGVAAGLAWTGGGGDLLSIEATTMAGRGKLTLTGNLGDVMQESAQAALTYARSRADLLALERHFYQKIDIHIHVPEGAIPKDGPSAGITMATALVSALTGISVRRDLAMTGEITLRGNVLPIGGLSEKLVAANQAGFEVVVLPRDNEKDLADVPEEVRRGLDLRFVETMDDVLDLALVGPGRDALPFFRRVVASPSAETPPPAPPRPPARGEPGYAH